jgi:uncharacterized membrane protein YgdD (TMEM256/DUF423 family)
MEIVVKSFGAFFGLASIILGAFAAHRFRKVLSNEVLQSFETGVRYMMYHALALLVLGFHLNFLSLGQRLTALFMISGVILFSFSIFGLCYGAYKKVNLRFLGPVTPIGGLLMVVAWVLLFTQFALGF